jgi:hypothetical protein
VNPQPQSRAGAAQDNDEILVDLEYVEPEVEVINPAGRHADLEGQGGVAELFQTARELNLMDRDESIDEPGRHRADDLLALNPQDAGFDRHEERPTPHARHQPDRTEESSQDGFDTPDSLESEYGSDHSDDGEFQDDELLELPPWDCADASLCDFPAGFPSQRG